MTTEESSKGGKANVSLLDKLGVSVCASDIWAAVMGLTQSFEAQSTMSESYM